MLGRVLSVDDIRDGTHWHNALALAQHIEDDYYRDLNEEALRKGEHRPPSKPLVSERILWIPVVPFSVYDGRVYGIDTRDGKVRELLDDAFTPGACPADAHSYGSIRAHLLTVCDHLRRRNAWVEATTPRCHQRRFLRLCPGQRSAERVVCQAAAPVLGPRRTSAGSTGPGPSLVRG